MNTNENGFIKNVIQEDLKTLPDPDFTANTIAKIKDLNEIRNLSTGNIKMLYPVLIYAIVVIVISIFRLFNLFLIEDQVTFLNDLIKVTFQIVFNPTTIAISVSILLLHYLDRYLTNLKAKHFQS